MHWFKVVGEVWLLCGVVTLIAGIFWTNKASREALQDSSRNYSSLDRRAEIGATRFSGASSA
jgi:hypothetical protein